MKSKYVHASLEDGLNVTYLWLGDDQLAQEYANWDFEETSNPSLYAFDLDIAYVIEEDEDVCVGDAIGDYAPIASWELQEIEKETTMQRSQK